ncbi:exportin-6 isoform x2 [Limosa lapponica baueri]|uniref:Exportin-6 isoform x2 n=1 Tax=Limosa lapponica baueri TaxID=1758121 RepID=A0A2I0T276_LIMLA|nr:exportin-6 isoform x2 [Limosa lapponica baueri]
MLKTTSEELACPREDLSVARKEELRKLLLDQVQTVLGLLTGKTNKLLTRHIFQIIATLAVPLEVQA